MTKRLIALAFAAAFGIAHAADTTTSGTSQNTTPPGKGVGADSAIGNVPQTTEPIGTNAAKKAHKKTHKKSAHKKSSAKSDAAPATDATK
jgi:hypothetical protein